MDENAEGLGVVTEAFRYFPKVLADNFLQTSIGPASRVFAAATDYRLFAQGRGCFGARGSAQNLATVWTDCAQILMH